MTSGHLSDLLSTLGVTRSHSRPHVSNDNPYSEAQLSGSPGALLRRGPLRFSWVW